MDPLNKLTEQVRFSSREIVRELGLLSKQQPYDLPLSFRHVLIELDLYGPLSHIELANILQVDKSTVSRFIKKLTSQKMVKINSNNTKDQRYKNIFITSAGKKALININKIANQQVNAALQQVSRSEQENIASAMALYAKSLQRSRMQNAFIIRSIQKSDNLEIMLLIKNVLKEYGADRPGFAFVDPELNDMYKAFKKSKSAYLVIEKKSDKTIVGGAGIGLLEGATESTCELKKMYLSANIRGIGLGYKLLQSLLSLAKENGYQQCYLETLNSMNKANHLYIKSGFSKLEKPIGNTGHFGCDAWYIKEL